MIRDPSKYTLHGVQIPSVTDVLRLSGLTDYSMVPADVLENARQRGQDVDEFATALDMGLLPDEIEPDPRIAGYVEAYKRFRREKPCEIVESQVPRIHETYRFAGTPDRVVRLEGALAIIDIKCTAAVMPETSVQLAAYAMLTGATRRFALQLRPDGTYRFPEYHDPNDLRVFLGALSVVHWKIALGRVSLASRREAA